MDNLELYNKVREVPKEAKKPITAGRLKGMTDINPMWRIKTLTEMFGACGIGWYYEVIDKNTFSLNNDSEVVVTIDINLYVRNGEEWSKPIFGTGGSKIQTMERNGAYVNDEAYKMALTDAISVACKELGFAADVYWNSDNTKYNDNKKLNSEEQQANAQMQKKITKREAVTLDGMIRSAKVDINEVLNAYKVKELAELTKEQYADCINRLPKQ